MSDRRLAARVHGPVNAEDLALVPGTDWVLTSGMRGPTASRGRLYAVDARDRSCAEVFPYGARTATGIEPLDPAVFTPHGIDVGSVADGTPVLLVVDHGRGESIARFAVGLDTERPRLTYLGSVLMPVGTRGNDVAALGDGGFLASTVTDTSAGFEEGMRRMLAGEETGGVVRWSPSAGWSVVPGSWINSANGVAARGGTVFVAGWRSACLRRIRCCPGRSPEVRTVETGCLTDNLTWAADGALLAAGAVGVDAQGFTAAYHRPDLCVPFSSRVLRIDPESLGIETVVEYDAPGLGVATTALEVGSEIWVGTARGAGVDVYR